MSHRTKVAIYLIVTAIELVLVATLPPWVHFTFIASCIAFLIVIGKERLRDKEAPTKSDLEPEI